MAAWAKIKFFWDTMLGSRESSLSVTSTETVGDYSVDYIHNWLEVGSWKSANQTTPIYITYDSGVGNTKEADYLTILGHNLFTVGALVSLEYSSTGAWSGEEVAVVNSTTPLSNKVFHREFTSPGSFRYWRLKISGTLTDKPYMSICVWGSKTELDFVSSSFDPHRVNQMATVALSSSGFVTGVHERFVQRDIKLSFSGADSTLYGKIKTWHDSVGLRNFFMAWDSTNSSDDVFLVRTCKIFNNPFDETGVYRDVTIELKGRRE